jgi:hypothetical protein
MKKCIACGMPMNEPAEFAMGDESKDYCVYCAREDGSMRSFEEGREGLAEFVVRTQGLDRTVALDIAESMMKKLPAWEDRWL